LVEAAMHLVTPGGERGMPATTDEQWLEAEVAETEDDFDPADFDPDAETPDGE